MDATAAHESGEKEGGEWRGERGERGAATGDSQA